MVFSNIAPHPLPVPRVSLLLAAFLLAGMVLAPGIGMIYGHVAGRMEQGTEAPACVGCHSGEDPPEGANP